MSSLLKQVDKNTTSKEPALAVGTTAGTVAGLLSLFLFLFPNLLTEKQFGTIAIILAFAAPLISAIATRKFVWSPVSVQQVLDEGIEQALKTAEMLKSSHLHAISKNAPEMNEEDVKKFKKDFFTQNPE